MHSPQLSLLLQISDIQDSLFVYAELVGILKIGFRLSGSRQISQVTLERFSSTPGMSASKIKVSSTSGAYASHVVDLFYGWMHS